MLKRATPHLKETKKVNSDHIADKITNLKNLDVCVDIIENVLICPIKEEQKLEQIQISEQPSSISQMVAECLI